MRKLVLGLIAVFGLFALIWGVQSQPNGFVEGIKIAPGPSVSDGVQSGSLVSNGGGSGELWVDFAGAGCSDDMSPQLVKGGGIGGVASGIYFGGEDIPRQYKNKISFGGGIDGSYKKKLSFLQSVDDIFGAKGKISFGAGADGTFRNKISFEDGWLKNAYKNKVSFGVVESTYRNKISFGLEIGGFKDDISDPDYIADSFGDPKY